MKKNGSAKSLQAKLYKKASPKVVAMRGILVQDSYFNKLVMKYKPLDTGWVTYVTKDFGRVPKGCQTPNHFYSASKPTKSLARRIRKYRLNKWHKLLRLFRREERMISRNEGEWKYFSKAHKERDPNVPDENDPRY